MTAEILLLKRLVFSRLSFSDEDAGSLLAKMALPLVTAVEKRSTRTLQAFDTPAPLCTTFQE